mgnify:CR=1 FL=1
MDELKKQLEGLTPEQVIEKALEWGKSMTESTGKIKELETALTERSAEFGKFRKLNQEERDKLTVREKELYDQQLELNTKMEELAKNQESFSKTQRETELKSLALTKANGNQALADKILFNYNRLADDDSTAELKLARIESAFALVPQQEVNTLLAAHNAGGGNAGPVEKKGEGFADSEAGKKAGQELGLSFAKDEPKKEEPNK